MESKEEYEKIYDTIFNKILTLEIEAKELTNKLIDEYKKKNKSQVSC